MTIATCIRRLNFALTDGCSWGQLQFYMRTLVVDAKRVLNEERDIAVIFDFCHGESGRWVGIGSYYP